MLRSLLVVVFLLGGLLIPSRAALAEPPAGYPQPTCLPAAEGHNELPGNDHRDPGPFWNWTYYMSLVRACAGDAHVSATSIPMDCDACLSFGAEGDAVALLQSRLVSLGFLSEDDRAGGEGTFGPLTRAAVLAFQDANGLPANGLYGEDTAAALARVSSVAAAGPDAGVPLDLAMLTR